MDDRLEVCADWGALDQVARFARVWHAVGGWRLADLAQLWDHRAVAVAPLPDDLFGFVVGLGGDGGRRWRISINDRLPLAAANATLAHEFGHTFQRVGLGLAHCSPRTGLPLIEQEAHAIGAVLTVPADAVHGLDLDDYDGARALAGALCVPATYATIRAALAVFLGERPGSTSSASAELNLGMLRHQGWMARISDYLSAQAIERPL